MRRVLAICRLLGALFLTQTVSASIASYDHCCIAECGEGDACAMPGCLPCGTPLMAAPHGRPSQARRNLDLFVGARVQWASWEASVWRPPD